MYDADSGLTAEEFFDLVEAHLTAPMAALGYHRIHGSVHNTPGARSINTTGGDTGQESRPYLWFNFGYEAGSSDVCRLLGPDDPDSEDEWWLHYEPGTGTLELGSWEPAVQAYVDWDVRRDEGPCSRDEVERRLSLVGLAVRAFVRDHGGFPVGP